MTRDEWLKRVSGVDINEVCESFDIPVHHGNFIPCLFHNDRTPTNCHLFGNRYKCFACGASGNGINLVAKKYDISYNEAAKKIAGMFGIPGYDGTEKSNEVPFPFKIKDLELIGLSSESHRVTSGKGDIVITDMDPKNSMLWSVPVQEVLRDSTRLMRFEYSHPTYQYAALYEGDIEQYVSFGTEPVSLQGLFREDPETFWYIVAGKLKEKVPIYIMAYEAEVWNNKSIFPGNNGPDIKNAVEAIINTVRNMTFIVWDKRHDLAKEMGLIFEWPENRKDKARFKLAI